MRKMLSSISSIEILFIMQMVPLRRTFRWGTTLKAQNMKECSNR